MLQDVFRDGSLCGVSKLFILHPVSEKTSSKNVEQTSSESVRPGRKVANEDKRSLRRIRSNLKTAMQQQLGCLLVSDLKVFYTEFILEWLVFAHKYIHLLQQISKILLTDCSIN